MAIAGLLVHTLKQDLTQVESRIKEMSAMTTYGCHQNQYVVVVAESPANQMEQTVKQIEDIEGVLTVYTTYVTVEDEG